MDPRHWEKIETLFHQVRDLPLAERATFLRRAAETTPDIRQEIESMLAHDLSDENSFLRAFGKAADEALKENTGKSKALLGRSIGPYRILSFVAAGGMGEIYRARHSKLDRDVALKVLPARVAQDPEQLGRCEREAKLLASLNHSNIAAIYDLVESDGIPCLVLEYIEGQTLAERLKRGRLPLAEAFDIARQIAEALESAHERGIIHRDLKPGNVMITPDGTVKVLDFGIAKIVQSGTMADPTQAAQSVSGGLVLGTPAYMSPEQVNRQPANRTSDIWAFGCVLFEMLTGHQAFDGDSVGEILGRVSQSEPDWTALPAETPSEIRKLVERCLRKDSRWRLQNIGDARIEIEEARSGRHTPATAVLQTTRKTHFGRIAALAVVTLTALVVLVLVFRPRPSTPEMRLEITTPPAMNPDLLSFVAISPDGQKVVFAASVSGGTRLWLRPLGSPSARPLAGTENGEFPFWSPDSRSIGFFAHERLKRIDIDGGAPQVLANAPLGRGGTWSREGVILFTPNNSGPLFRVPATGGTAEAVTKLQGIGGNHRLPRFLPDGRHFLYFSGDGTVYSAALDGSETRRILETRGAAEYSNTGHLIFQRQSTLFAQRFDPVQLTLTGVPYPVADHVLNNAWSVSEAGPIVYRTAPANLDAPRQLVWFDRSGKPSEQINPPLSYSDLGLSLSLDGGQMAVTGRAANAVTGSLWLLELKRGTLNRLTDLWPASYPIWSPDGRRIVFGHYDPNTNMDLYRRNVNSGTDELLLRTTANKAATDWSADGRFILFRSPDPKTGIDLWAFQPDGDRTPFQVVRTDADERDGQFSPDGKWVAYQSNESGQFEIYIQPFPAPGPRHRISANGGAQVRWRRDGRELFYIALDSKLMSVPIRLAADGKSIDAGSPAPLFAARVSAVQFDRQQYFVSADGQHFLMNTFIEETTNSPITVILNYKPKS